MITKKELIEKIKIEAGTAKDKSVIYLDSKGVYLQGIEQGLLLSLEYLKGLEPTLSEVKEYCAKIRKLDYGCCDCDFIQDHCSDYQQFISPDEWDIEAIHKAIKEQ